MGLYDRDYGRQDRTPWDRIENPRSIIVTLIVINVAVWVCQLLFKHSVTELPGIAYAEPQEISYLEEWCAISGSSLFRPWLWFQTLTYGFLHSMETPFHLAGNMLMLFFFGKPLEQRYGPQRFLKAYLVAIVCGGFVAMTTPLLYGLFFESSMMGTITIGASGGVAGVLIIFAMLYPDEQALLFFVIPVKVRYLAIGFVVMDTLGIIGVSAGNTAHGVHLAGALFGFLYVRKGWTLEWLDLDAIAGLPDKIRSRSGGAKLKLHDPEKKIRVEAEEADRILAKIHEEGESSLTRRERKTLEKYSRRQRAKREF